MAADARVIASGGRLVEGVAAMREAFRGAFTDPQFVTFVRTPRQVVVGGNSAVEHGVWEGRWRNRRQGGEYMSRWNHAPDGWRIVAELYVPLTQP